MKKITLLFASLLCVAYIAVAQLKLYVYQNDGTRTEFVASTVDSIAFSTTEKPNQPDAPVKPEETIERKLYFVNKAGWTDVKAYIWSSEDGKYNIAWPGESAYKDNYRINGYEVYSYDMSDKQLYDMIIFNGLATSTSTVLSQTSDLEIDYSKPYYYDGIWFSSLDDIVDKSEPSGYHNGYQYVDLGLPSGTKWATMNVGADSPEDYGDYFAWGETEPKNRSYNWSNYKWCEGSEDTQTKYCTLSIYGTVDNKTVLELADDAANANWGGDWRMPTKSELDELNTSYTTWTWTTQNGVNGYKVTSKINGNSIFLPAAGGRGTSGLLDPGSIGVYWSSSLNAYDSDRAYGLGFDLDFDLDYVSWGYELRLYGQSVRPVLRVE